MSTFTRLLVVHYRRWRRSLLTHGNLRGDLWPCARGAVELVEEGPAAALLREGGFQL